MKTLDEWSKKLLKQQFFWIPYPESHDTFFEMCIAERIRGHLRFSQIVVLTPGHQWFRSLRNSVTGTTNRSNAIVKQSIRPRNPLLLIQIAN